MDSTCDMFIAVIAGLELAKSLEQLATDETIDTFEPVASPNSSINSDLGFSTYGLTVLESELGLRQ